MARKDLIVKDKPDYGFENGLRITALDFRTGSQTELGISREELQATPQADERLAAEVAERMANPRLIRGLGGTALEVATIGPEDADNVTFVSYGWGGNVRHPVAVYEAQVLAANNRDSQLVFMNNFGTGNSSLLPKPVTEEIRKRGTYLPMGEYVASVFNKIAEGRTTHLRGHSLGARTATGVAPHLETNPETMILNDPTGTRKMGLLAIASNFALREGGHLKGYVEGGFDPVASDLQRHPVKSSVWDTAEGTKGGWKQQLLIDPSGLKLNAFEGDLHQAVGSVESLIRIISPELSELNKPEAIAEILGRCRDIEGAPSRVEQYVLHDHTHSVVTIPQVLARLYGDEWPQ